MPELFSSRRWRLLALLVGNGLLQVAVMAVIVFSIRGLLSELRGTQGQTDLVFLAALLGGNLALGMLKWRELVTAQRLGEDYAMEARRSAFHHLGKLSLHAQTRLRGGSLQLRFVNDLTAVRNWISLGLARLVVSSIICVGAIAAMWWIDPALALALCGILAAAMAGALAIGRLFDESIREARKRRGRIAANIAEKIANMSAIQAFANLDGERRRLRQQSRHLADAQVEKAAVTGIFRGFMISVLGSGIALMVLVSSWTGGTGGPDAGSLIAAIGLFTLVSPNLFRFGRVYEYWKGARIAREKLSQMFLLGPAIDPAPAPKKLPREFSGVRMVGVSVGTVLRSVDCRIDPADRIVLKGENGAGKTTLLYAILRLIEVQSGKVLISGKDVRTIRTGNLRRQVSIVSPALGLMKGTIRSNIAYGSSRADDRAVEIAAARCVMDGGNPHSPYFLDRPVREGGRNLSAGERMRVIMARALVSNPRLLLLDEPETHLDSASLEVLIELLAGYDGAWLAASHCDVFDSLATHIWHLRQGRLAPSSGVLAA